MANLEKTTNLKWVKRGNKKTLMQEHHDWYRNRSTWVEVPVEVEEVEKETPEPEQNNNPKLDESPEETPRD